MANIQFRDVVKRYTDPGEALGRDPDTGDVTGLEPGTDVDPVEVVTDPAAQAALSATFARLRTWASTEMWALTNVTRNSDGVVTSADITWPDGSTGTFTGTPNLSFGALDAWTATHDDSGQQVTQPTVTRNADGDITDAPALVLEDTP